MRLTWKERLGVALLWAITYCVSLEVWRYALSP